MEEKEEILDSTINSALNARSLDGSGYSPINSNKKSPKINKNPLNSNPVNPGESDKIINDSIKIDGSVTSKLGEILDEKIKDTSTVSTINISLDKISEEKENPTNINNSTTINNISNNSNTANNSVKTESADSNSITNSSVISKIEKIESTINEASSTPIIKEILDKSREYLETAINSSTENISKVSEKIDSNTLNSNSYLNEIRDTSISNKSVVNNIEKINEGIKSIESLKSSEKIDSTNSLINSRELNSITLDRKNVEISKPSEIKEVTNNTSSNLNNTETKVTASSNESNLTTTNNSQVTAQQVQPVQEMKPIENIVNIDISKLVNSISRLERILLSGIDVTLKDA